MTALALCLLCCDAATPLTYDDPDPQRYTYSLRASDLDTRVRSYPRIGFYIEKDGKPADQQVACVDTSVPTRGKLVIWLMAPNSALFERLNSYGLHVIQPHYARHWFGTLCRENPVGETCRGDVRLEAATGEDHSPQLGLRRADGMAERARRMVQHLAKEHPGQG